MVRASLRRDLSFSCYVSFSKWLFDAAQLPYNNRRRNFKPTLSNAKALKVPLIKFFVYRTCAKEFTPFVNLINNNVIYTHYEMARGKF